MTLKRLFLLIALCLPAGIAGAQDVTRIAAVVNDSAITQDDMNQRIRLAEAAANSPDSAEERDKLRPVVLHTLIDEQLELQEAKRLNVLPAESDVDASFAKVAQQNKLEPAAFEEALKRQGISVDAVRAQIRAQLAWIKVVQKEVRPRVDISSEDVDAELERLKSNAGKPRYLAAEIFLSVDTPDQDAQVKAEADRLVEQLRNGGNFALAARQFSQSAGANSGGDLGWVQEGQLSPTLEGPLSKLRPGEITDPIHDVAGYHILLLRERGIVAGPEADKVKIHLVQIVMPVKDSSPAGFAADLKQSSQITDEVQSCEAAKAKAQSMNDGASGDLGDVNLSQLPPQIVSAVENLPVGKFAPPLRTPKGYLLLMVCGRDQPDAVLPSRDEIANQIGFERLDLQQRRYLRDLRASAYIDIRS